MSSAPSQAQAKVSARSLVEARVALPPKLGRYRVDYEALDEDETEHKRHAFLLLSRNTKEGQKPYRVTLFNDSGETLVHADLDRGELSLKWEGDGHLDDGFLIFMQDHIDPEMQSYTFTPVEHGPAFAPAVVEALLRESPEMKTLKDSKQALTDEERAEVMKAKAVWHHGPNGEETPAVWKSVVRGKTWYVTNTHRCYQCRTTLRAAIRAYHDVVKETA